MPDRLLYIHSLFVSYPKEVPSAQRIPYTAGAALDPDLLSRLARQVLNGQVQMVQMQNETMEDSLEADFRDGWATVYLVKEVHRYYEFLNHQFPHCQEPLSITGDGPTPKMHATRDLSLMAEILTHFARTGQPFPGCRWKESTH